jgi:hypothetical protein
MKQTSDTRNSERHCSETSSLESLARKVLQRNAARNKNATRPQSYASPPIKPETTDQSLFRDLYHERAAILEFEASLVHSEAESRAYLEVLKEFVASNHPEIKANFEQIIHSPPLH